MGRDAVENAYGQCPSCGKRLSSQGTCYKLACLPKERSSMGGKGTGRGNWNLLEAQKKAKSRCPLCVEARCWPSVCRNGPYNARLGHRAPCTCHEMMRATSPHLTTQLRARSFGMWQGPPAL